MLDREGLQSIRRHIADNMDEFSALLAEPGFRAMWGEVRGDKHKRVPKEFQEAHADQPLIANKQFYFWTELGPEVVTSADLVDVLMEHYLASLPVSRFLEKALNP
jgi:uncharacterized protein (DUF2461 family)